MQVSPELVQWLANGERGVSSNTMVTHLCGIDATGDWGADHPHDPDDLSRCRKLLEQVPELAPMLPRMATCLPGWGALVWRWQELCDLMDEEAPEWRTGKGSAPKTFALMRSLIKGARAGNAPGGLP
jgi:hypothetical protein